jgi:flagellar biosynthesis/type III secretory pathway protein FliH
MKGAVVAALCLAMLSAPLWAKLPAPQLTEEQKAANAAKAAKAAEAAKKDAELLGKYQDAVANKYKKGQPSAKAKGASSAMATPKK